MYTTRRSAVWLRSLENGCFMLDSLNTMQFKRRRRTTRTAINFAGLHWSPNTTSYPRLLQTCTDFETVWLGARTRSNDRMALINHVRLMLM